MGLRASVNIFSGGPAGSPQSGLNAGQMNIQQLGAGVLSGLDLGSPSPFFRPVSHGNVENVSGSCVNASLRIRQALKHAPFASSERTAAVAGEDQLSRGIHPNPQYHSELAHRSQKPRASAEQLSEVDTPKNVVSARTPFRCRPEVGKRSPPFRFEAFWGYGKRPATAQQFKRRSGWDHTKRWALPGRARGELTPGKRAATNRRTRDRISR